LCERQDQEQEEKKSGRKNQIMLKAAFCGRNLFDLAQKPVIGEKYPGGSPKVK
jgi:hypothetical protein